MSKKLLIAIVAVLAVGTVLYFKGVRTTDDGVTGPGATSGTVTYTCDANKSFSLRYVDANTVRLEGSGITSVSLDKNAAGYWVKADGKTTVKTVGSYVVLVQNDKVTHDRCSSK